MVSITKFLPGPKALTRWRDWLSQLNSRWRYVVPLLLMAMLMMRLVWLQLRTYNLESDYRSLATLGYMHLDFPELCGGGVNRADDAGVREFMLMKDIQTVQEYRAFISPGFELFASAFCRDGNFNPKALLKFNQWMLLYAILACVLFVRLLTRSWVLAIATAVILLSLGHLISLVGELAYHDIYMMIVSVWVVATVHFFHSGAGISFLVALASSSLIGVFFDPSALALAFVLPLLLMIGVLLREFLARPVVLRLRQERQRLDNLARAGGVKLYEGGVISGVLIASINWIINRPDTGQDERRGRKKTLSANSSSGFLGALRQPFAIWVLQRNRISKILWVSLVVAAFSACAWVFLRAHLAGISGFSSADHWEFVRQFLQHGNDAWWRGLLEPVDLHYGISLLVLLMCALQSPASGLINVFETVWLVLFAMVLVTLFCFAFDVVDLWYLGQVEANFGEWSVLAWGRSSHILVWFEPVVLSLGVVGFYQLLLIGDYTSTKRPL